MKPATTWNDLLNLLKRGVPLEFVHAIRHPVARTKSHSVHSHPSIEIVFHAAGTGQVLLPGNRTLRFPEHGTVIHAPGESHDQVMDCDGEDICVHVAAPAGINLTAAGSLCIEAVGEAAALADIEFLGKAHPRPDPIEKVILNLRATSLLMTLLRQTLQATATRDASQSDENRIFLAERYMMENYQTIRSIREVAGNVEIGYDHLRHIFKAARGKSLVRYLNEIRISQAKSHLVYSILPVKQIASLCGFQDEYYFSAVFRKFEGLSPLQFRQRGTGPVRRN